MGRGRIHMRSGIDEMRNGERAYTWKYKECELGKLKEGLKAPP